MRIYEVLNWNNNPAEDDRPNLYLDVPSIPLTGLAPEPIPNLRTGDDYRDLADKIREVARETRLPVARRELVKGV